VSHGTFSKPFLFLQFTALLLWTACWVDSMLRNCCDFDGIWWWAIVWNCGGFIWLVGLEFGAFTDLVGRVENAEDSSDVELDEFDEIELLGLFHPTAAKIFGSFYHNHLLKSMIRTQYCVFATSSRPKVKSFVRSMSKVWVFLRVRARSFGFYGVGVRVRPLKNTKKWYVYGV